MINKMINGAVAIALTAVFATALLAKEINPKLSLVFQGKGTHFGWDIGSLKAITERTTSLTAENYIITGNSSGAVLAGFFACRGITPESIVEAENEFRNFDRSLVEEVNIKEKIRDWLRGNPLGAPHSNLYDALDRITKFGECQARFPTVIVASNADVLDNKVRGMAGRVRPFVGRNIKRVNYSNNNVSLYGRFIGKACTYFVDPYMFEKLSVIPYNELLCDLRLMENSADIRTAILASASEPTYFPELKDPNPEKLIGLSPELAARRSYQGGFVIPTVAQDVRRVFPQVYSYGTGRNDPTNIELKMVQAWFLLDIANVMKLSKWWLDIQTSPTDALWKEMIFNLDDYPYDREVALGYRKANWCMDNNTCQAACPRKPYFTTNVCPENEPNCEVRGLQTRRGMNGFIDSLK